MAIAVMAWAHSIRYVVVKHQRGRFEEVEYFDTWNGPVGGWFLWSLHFGIETALFR